MDNEGYSRIEEQFLEQNDLFALRFNSGLVFLEVTGWEQANFAPYNEIGTIGSGNASGFSRLDTSDGDDVLFVERRRQQVMHVGIGHTPAHIRRYTNYPEGQVRLRRVPNVGTPVAGDDFGYIDGEDSPYQAPTNAEELYIPPGERLDFSFFNPSNEESEPVLNIVARVYQVRPLDPNDSWDKKAISRIVSPGSPMPIAPVGSMRRQSRYELEDSWDVDTITAEEARRMN